MCFRLFFFNAPAPTEIYTLSLHDALPISQLVLREQLERRDVPARDPAQDLVARRPHLLVRSEEHTSELQSPYDLVCRLLLEKKKKKTTLNTQHHSRIHTKRPYQVTLSHIH